MSKVTIDVDLLSDDAKHIISELQMRSHAGADCRAELPDVISGLVELGAGRYFDIVTQDDGRRTRQIRRVNSPWYPAGLLIEQIAQGGC